jgi:hypothetical protein
MRKKIDDGWTLVIYVARRLRARRRYWLQYDDEGWWVLTGSEAIR